MNDTDAKWPRRNGYHEDAKPKARILGTAPPDPWVGRGPIPESDTPLLRQLVRYRRARRLRRQVLAGMVIFMIGASLVAGHPEWLAFIGCCILGVWVRSRMSGN